MLEAIHPETGVAEPSILDELQESIRMSKVVPPEHSINRVKPENAV
jgi:hypothetical protein